MHHPKCKRPNCPEWVSEEPCPACERFRNEDEAAFTSAPTSKGVQLITLERQRQIAEEAFDPGHDAEHDDGELAIAAACYALPQVDRSRNAMFEGRIRSFLEFFWPFEMSWWKPTPEDRIRELTKAGALIAAEIDRLIQVLTLSAPVSYTHLRAHET